MFKFQTSRMGVKFMSFEELLQLDIAVEKHPYKTFTIYFTTHAEV